VIPLHGKTSLGLVYDKSVVDFKDVNTGEKLIEWACEHFPCFRHDLPKRKLLCTTACATTPTTANR
jgi:hypothetical protein